MIFLSLLLATLANAEPLSIVYPANAEPFTAGQVSFSLVDRTLHALFEIKGAALKRKPKLGPGEYPYQFEVTELFLSVDGGLPYYELELTPYGDTLQMMIKDPKHLNVPTINVGIETKTNRTSEGFTTELIVPLDHLHWQGDVSKIVGNAFAILGAKPNRRFYSMNPLPPQKKPNFHVPEAFGTLILDP